MKKKIITALVFFVVFFSLTAAYAQFDPALVPANDETVQTTVEQNKTKREIETLQEAKEQKEERRTGERIRYESILPAPDNPIYGVDPNKTLGEKFADGTFALNDIPHLLIYWINLGSRLSPMVGVLMIIYSGWLFLFSGISDSKEIAKNAFASAIIGVAIVPLAWIIPAWLQLFMTS